MNGLDISSMRTDELINREWLAVNHLGGYASSSVVGLNTRKYHGLLVAALAPPVRRMVILSRVEDWILKSGKSHALSCCEYPGVIHPDGRPFLRAFTSTPYPRWALQGDNWTVEKSVRLIDGENTVVLTYTLLAGDAPVELEVKPLFALRGIHELMYQWQGRLDGQKKDTDGAQLRIPPTARTPEAFFAHDGRFAAQPNWYLSTIYRRETERGYNALEDVWMPGPVRWKLMPGKSVHFVCSTEPIDLAKALAKASANFPRQSEVEVPGADETLDVLTRAADQFIVAAPDGAVSEITGFPWAMPSGRDAMISLPGLLLATRRFAQARSVLEFYATHLQRGLIPSDFPEDGSPPLYNSADAALWFVNAVYAYWKQTSDYAALQKSLLKAVVEIIAASRGGTSLGISCDADGLIASRAIGIGTSWMNAKVDDWVITPRAGRTVELNALWYNAVRIASELSERVGQPGAPELHKLADSVRTSFNNRFWNADARCCFDVLGDNSPDPAIRPNQIFALSLPFPVLAPEKNIALLEKVRSELLTPVGLRTLAPDDPSYRGRYSGDVISRDRAYHQGSAYPWLLGPFITALVRTHGAGHSTKRQAQEILAGAIRYMQSDGLGQLCELFDGDKPHNPGGMIASARSVAEILRCYVEDVLEPLIKPMPDPHRAAV